MLVSLNIDTFPKLLTVFALFIKKSGLCSISGSVLAEMQFVNMARLQIV